MPYRIRRKLQDRLDTKDVAGSRLVIGKGPNADLRLEHDAVALEHAWIQEEAGHYTLIDRKSATGTYLKGKRIEKAPLADGDRITIGPFLLNVHLSGFAADALSLDVSPIAESTEPKQATAKSQRIDYAAAYALSQKFLNKTFLTVILTVGGVAVLAGFLFAAKGRIFRPGAVSDAHAMFANDCGRCHVPWGGVTEQTCQECHAGPVHHKEQAFAPTCMSCHPEHQGQKFLARAGNQNCVQCHANLKTKGNGPSQFQGKITDFSRDHPEFAVALKNDGGEKRLRLNETTARQSDFSKIKLNHEVHLKPGLKSPKGSVQLACKDCHTPAVDGRLMKPVTYEVHCKDCHELGFDDQYPKRQVPHAEPEAVHAYLLRVYAEFPDERVSYPEAPRRFPLLISPEKINPSLLQRIRRAESQLYGVTCKECHEVNQKSGALAEIEKPRIPVVWLAHARFSHKPHRILACASCHEGVFKSKETADVLLPGIETCRSCHRQQLFERQQATATTECAACHVYHNKTEERDWDGRFDVKLSLDPARKKAK